MIGQAVCHPVLSARYPGRKAYTKIPACPSCAGGCSRAFKDGCSSSVQYLYQLIFLLLCNNILIRAGNEASVAVFDMLQNASYLILYLYEGGPPGLCSPW